MVLALLFDVSIAALIVLPIVLVQGCSDGPETRSDATPLAVVSLLIFVTARMADFGFLVTTTSARVLGLTSLAAVFLALGRKNRDFSAVLFSLFRGVVAISIALLVNLQPYISRGVVSAGAPFTSRNNDLAIYIMSADNFVRSGFNEEGRVISYLTGARARFEVSGAASLIGWISKFTGVEVWRATNSTMLIVIALTVLATDRLLRWFTNRGVLALIAACAGAVLPYARTAQYNYFLSQALSRLLLMLMLLGIVQFFRGADLGLRRRGLVLSTLATATSFVAYPVGTVSSIAVAGCLTSSLAFHDWLQAKWSWSRILAVGLVPMAAMLLVMGRLHDVWSNIVVYSRPNATGWKSPTLDLYWWSGLRVIGLDSIVGAWFIGVASIVLALLLCRIGSQRSSKLPFELELFVALLFAICGLLLGHIGSETYQAWKFVSVIQQLLVSGLMVAVVNSVLTKGIRARRGSAITLTFLLASLTATNLRDSYRDWSNGSQAPDITIAEFKSYSVIRNNQPLYINLDPYLETMIAPALLGIHQSFYASPTYLGPGAPVGERCTFTRTKWDDSYIALGRGYYVGPANRCNP